MKTDRTALDSAEHLEFWSEHPTAPILAIDAKEAADMLRYQHAEIVRLKHDKAILLDLLSIIHRDGGHYTFEHGIENACADARSKIVESIDAACEQTRLAEREACADLCEDSFDRFDENDTCGCGAMYCAEAIRAREKK